MRMALGGCLEHEVDVVDVQYKAELQLQACKGDREVGTRVRDAGMSQQ
jgi:hypothetical protein